LSFTEVKLKVFSLFFSVVLISPTIIIIWRNEHTTMNLNVLDEDNNKHRHLLAAVATGVFISSKTKKFVCWEK